MTTEEMNGLASLARKKAAIMAELKKFGKDAYNQNQKYKFPSAASIFDTIRGLMAAHGLVLFTSAVDGHQDPMESKSGTAGYHTVVLYRMMWIDTETGAMFEDMWRSESDDYQDKGHSKAATLALKSYLLTSFIVSSGEEADDPDSGIGSQETAKRETRQNRTKTPPPAPNENGHENIRRVTLQAPMAVSAQQNGSFFMTFATVDGEPIYEFDFGLWEKANYCYEGEWRGKSGKYTLTQAPDVTIYETFNKKGESYWRVKEIHNPVVIPQVQV